MTQKNVLLLTPAVIVAAAYIMAAAGAVHTSRGLGFLLLLSAIAIMGVWFFVIIFNIGNKSKPKPTLVKVTAIGGTYCPKCKRDGGFFHYHYPPEEPYYRCENCNSKITDAEYEELMKPKELKEKDLNIYDVWESPNGNLFLKVSDDYSLALGTKGDHAPTKAWGDLEHTQYVKSSDIFPVVKVGRIVFDEDAITNYKRSLE